MTYDHWKTTNPDDEYLGDVLDDQGGCPNCGGEGVIYMCLEEYACIDPEGGCDMCARRCDWCAAQGKEDTDEKGMVDQ
jgi:hypothetical protein